MDGLRFDGVTFDRDIDGKRLGRQLLAVKRAVWMGEWRTLWELAQQTGYPEASVSARLRDLRKERFGGHDIQGRRRDVGQGGTWEYRLRRDMDLFR